MNNLSQYIIEKLHINKDTVVNNPIRLRYKDEINYIYQEGIPSIYNSACIRLASKYKKKEPLIRIYAELMYMTNSIPFIKDENIYSFCGNYGQGILDRAIDLGATNEEIMEECKKFEDTEPYEIPEKVIDSIKEKIEYVFNNGNYKIIDCKLLFDGGIDAYSDYAKEFITENTGKIIIPFNVTLEKDTKKANINCEICTDKYAYYFYMCNGKVNRFSRYFYDEIDKYLK